MKFLYGTSNFSKLSHMKQMLKGLNIDLYGLSDLGINIKVDESGSTPMENARIKALAYYKASKIPTFSCDSGLYMEGLSKDKQPGVFVRRKDCKNLNDEEYIKYYTDLVLKMVTEPRAKFKNAICLVLNENKIYEYDGEDIADNFIITSKASHKRKLGFPMDSISIDTDTGKYIIDLDDKDKKEEKIKEGFRNFFIRSLKEGVNHV